ncbi:hypothetical protein CQW31_26825 [Pseudomonas sp. 382]|nr:hypothetical protein DZC31_05405 [Stenotrophomonas rhizophila]PIK75477.1 hypothetical protein CQW31_26825 [Pseudomonas sp. 382]
MAGIIKDIGPGCLSCPNRQPCRGPCGSGLVSRKGRRAVPGFQLRHIKCRSRFAALSRRKAVPTRTSHWLSPAQ